MNRNFSIALFCVLFAAALSATLVAEQKTQPATASDASEAEHFTLKVLPLLKEKCLGCHGADADDLKGDYDIRTLAAATKGGESEEAAIVPGKPDESPLYHAVMWDGLEMPPKENDRLTQQQTKMIRRWIAAGAPWPTKKLKRKYARPNGPLKKTMTACWYQPAAD